MVDFNFITVRLGKDSVSDIEILCSSNVGILNKPFQISVKCTQVPDNYKKDDYAFIWLGSDNNKGMPTKWKQGFKAVGRVEYVMRGKNYNDTSITNITILYVFPDSVNRLDILRYAPIAYYWCSSMPLIGIDDHANQTIRNMSGSSFSDLNAFFTAINLVTKRFENEIIQVEPKFKKYFNVNLPKPQDYPFAKSLSEIKLSVTKQRLDQPHQQIFYGAPGTGKSFKIKEQTEGKDVIRTTFHPDSDYSTFVGCYKPTTKEVPVISTFGGKAIKVKDDNGEEIKEERIVYEFVEQAFLQAYIKAWKLFARAEEGKNPEDVYLVIEEINRGNCAQIFGDLFQLLDRGEDGFSEYPIMADKDMQKQLAKAFADMPFLNAPAVAGMSAESVAVKIRNGEILLLPNNLYIWATMNTSDQSLFPIDSAFKRRWDWQYVPIANAGKNWIIEVNGKQYDWWDFLEKINALIGETTNSEDKKLGYFFCKTTDGIISADTFVSKVIFYLWNDVFKDFEFEGDVFIDEDKESKLSFDKFYRTDANGHPAVRENKVDLFLTNLGVKFAQDAEDFDEEDLEDLDENNNGAASDSISSDGKDRSKYSINGQGSFNKRKLALECVKLYSNSHPNLSAQELVDVWMGLNLLRTNFIETSNAHAVRATTAQNDNHFEQRYYSYTLPNNNGIVYINNQFKVESINDFIEKVNSQNWGIQIEKL